MSDNLNVADVNKIKELAAKKDYKKALELLKKINIEKSMNPQFLRICGEVYIENKKYDDARKILILGHKMSPKATIIIAELIELYLKMGYFTKAQEYYKIFKAVAEVESVEKKIVDYSIMKALQYPDGDLIAKLKEICDLEYTEQWAFELALVYRKAGQVDDCVSECSKLMSNFSASSVYCKWAKALKMGSLNINAAFNRYPKEEINESIGKNYQLVQDENEQLKKDRTELFGEEDEAVIIEESYDDGTGPFAGTVKNVFDKVKGSIARGPEVEDEVEVFDVDGNEISADMVEIPLDSIQVEKNESMLLEKVEDEETTNPANAFLLEEDTVAARQQELEEATGEISDIQEALLRAAKKEARVREDKKEQYEQVVREVQEANDEREFNLSSMLKEAAEKETEKRKESQQETTIEETTDSLEENGNVSIEDEMPIEEAAEQEETIEVVESTEVEIEQEVVESEPFEATEVVEEVEEVTEESETEPQRDGDDIELFDLGAFLEEEEEDTEEQEENLEEIEEISVEEVLEDETEEVVVEEVLEDEIEETAMEEVPMEETDEIPDQEVEEISFEDEDETEDLDEILAEDNEELDGLTEDTDFTEEQTNTEVFEDDEDFAEKEDFSMGENGENKPKLSLKIANGGSNGMNGSSRSSFAGGGMNRGNAYINMTKEEREFAAQYAERQAEREREAKERALKAKAQMARERQQREEAEARAKLEAEKAARLAEEEAERRAKEDAIRAEEEAKQAAIRAEEEAKQAALREEEERLRKEEEERLAAIRAEEDAKRTEEEREEAARRAKEEEELRLQREEQEREEAARLAEEERIRREEEEKLRKEEEETQRLEREKAEEAAKKEEEEKKRKEEEEREKILKDVHKVRSKEQEERDNAIAAIRAKVEAERKAKEEKKRKEQALLDDAERRKILAMPDWQKKQVSRDTLERLGILEEVLGEKPEVKEEEVTLQNTGLTGETLSDAGLAGETLSNVGHTEVTLENAAFTGDSLVHDDDFTTISEDFIDTDTKGDDFLDTDATEDAVLEEIDLDGIQLENDEQVETEESAEENEEILEETQEDVLAEEELIEEKTEEPEEEQVVAPENEPIILGAAPVEEVEEISEEVQEEELEQEVNEESVEEEQAVAPENEPIILGAAPVEETEETSEEVQEEVLQAEELDEEENEESVEEQAVAPENEPIILGAAPVEETEETLQEEVAPEEIQEEVLEEVSTTEESMEEEQVVAPENEPIILGAAPVEETEDLLEETETISNDSILEEATELEELDVPTEELVDETAQEEIQEEQQEEPSVEEEPVEEVATEEEEADDFDVSDLELNEQGLPVITEKYIGKYVASSAVRRQVLKPVKNIIKKRGIYRNIVVLTNEGCSVTNVAIDFARAYYEIGICKTKIVATINAKILNKTDISKTLPKIKGGCLVIENAGDLNSDKAKEIAEIANDAENDIVIMLVGEVMSVTAMFGKNPELTALFHGLFQFHSLTDSDLFDIAMAYMKQLNYEADEGGIHRLKTRIRTLEHNGIDNVLAIIDGAIVKAEKRSQNNLSDVVFLDNYEDSDFNTLKEFDFE